MNADNKKCFADFKEKNLISQAAYDYLCGENTIDSLKSTNSILPEKKISISITTHNRADQLKRLLSTVFMQYYSNYEVIVVDDASTDNTEELMAQLCIERPGIIKYYRNNPNKGVTFSKRKGFELSEGEILIFSDDDDFFIDKYYFQKVNEIYANNEDCVMTVASTLTHDEKDDRYIPDILNFNVPIETKEYLNGFMTKYTKPNSMFTLTVNAKKLNDIGYNNLKCFNDCSLYLFATLTKGKVYPIVEAVGIYSKQVFSMSSGIAAGYTIENINAKLDICNRGKQIGAISNPNRWFYDQCMITLRVFFQGKIKTKKEFFEVSSWLIKNMAFPYNICSVCYGIKSRLSIWINNRRNKHKV